MVFSELLVVVVLLKKVTVFTLADKALNSRATNNKSPQTAGLNMVMQ